ncbi:uncharacterized protein LOC135808941 [Sycon ciliatum]|uniref:uncharacterized protein LOC135808941 n=1 Tax=Sycon ciliatum TaxID=27933 RepID=UPI0031F71F57
MAKLSPGPLLTCLIVTLCCLPGLNSNGVFGTEAPPVPASISSEAIVSEGLPVTHPQTKNEDTTPEGGQQEEGSGGEVTTDDAQVNPVTQRPGNSDPALATTTESDPTKTLAIALGAVWGAVCILLVVILIVIVQRSRQNREHAGADGTRKKSTDDLEMTDLLPNGADAEKGATASLDDKTEDKDNPDGKTSAEDGDKPENGAELQESATGATKADAENSTPSATAAAPPKDVGEENAEGAKERNLASSSPPVKSAEKDEDVTQCTAESTAVSTGEETKTDTQTNAESPKKTTDLQSVGESQANSVKDTEGKASAKGENSNDTEGETSCAGTTEKPTSGKEQGDSKDMVSSDQGQALDKTQQTKESGRTETNDSEDMANDTVTTDVEDTTTKKGEEGQTSTGDSNKQDPTAKTEEEVVAETKDEAS